MSTNIDELLSRLDSAIKGKKPKPKCKGCGEVKPIFKRGLCEPCYLPVREQELQALKEKRNHSSDGYVYVYDENGKYGLEHRFVMEKILGRKLESWEGVTWKDGNRTNNSPDNLILTLRAGFNLSELVCKCCGEPYVKTTIPTADQLSLLEASTSVSQASSEPSDSADTTGKLPLAFGSFGLPC